tara:strand:- start:3056 stop:4564 length:1509 start_codon:yes stop_codon:yes gene_type:complete
MASVVECGDKNLPRDLDVQIDVTRRTFETETDLSVAVGVVVDGPLRHGAGRIRYYTEADQLAADGWASTSEAQKMANAFSPQPGRALRFAIAQVFTVAQAGFARYGALGDLADFQAVTNGNFAIAIDGVSNDIISLDFSSDLSLDDVAATVQTGIQAIASGGFTAATAVNDGGQLIITSGTTGSGSSVSVMSAIGVPAGTDISGDQYLGGLTASSVPGYTPSTLSSELSLVEEAARCSGRFVYAWDLDESYRDSPEHFEFAEWILARTAIGSILSNDILAKDPNSTGDIGVLVQALGSSRLHVGYHDNVNRYPGMAVFAQMLGVNYGAEDSVRTAKFLDLEGIETVGLDVTDWNVLQSKGYNVHTATGNSTRVYRDGINSKAPIWYLDQRITLDNYAEELSVALFNLLKTGKLGINAEGQTREQDQIDTVNERYVFNGALSARRQSAPTTREGFIELPPYQTTLTPLELWGDAERAAREMTPAVVDLNLTDFAHTIRVSVRA